MLHKYLTQIFKAKKRETNIDPDKENKMEWSFLIRSIGMDLHSMGSSTYKYSLSSKKPYTLLKDNKLSSLPDSYRIDSAKILLTFQEAQVTEALMKCIDIKELEKIKDGGSTPTDGYNVVTVEKDGKSHSIENIYTSEPHDTLYLNESFINFQALLNHIYQILNRNNAKGGKGDYQYMDRRKRNEQILANSFK